MVCCAASGARRTEQGAPVKKLIADITGIVQGVGFRSFVRDAAVRLGVQATAENMDDGSVHVLAWGDDQQLLLLLALLKQGSRFSSVDRIDYLLEDWQDDAEGS